MSVVLKVKEVIERLGISRARYDEMIKDGTLPYCLKKNSNHKFHLESHIAICKRNLEAGTIIRRRSSTGTIKDKFGKRLTGAAKVKALRKMYS